MRIRIAWTAVALIYIGCFALMIAVVIAGDVPPMGPTNERTELDVYVPEPVTTTAR